MSLAATVRSCILNVARVLFVDRVVSEVHVRIFHIAIFGLFVRNCCKSGKALLKKVNSQRLHSIQQYVDPEIKLQPINQVGVLDVVLRYLVVLNVDFFEVLSQINSLALRLALWLNDERLIGQFRDRCKIRLRLLQLSASLHRRLFLFDLLEKLSLKQIHFIRQYVCCR